VKGFDRNRPLFGQKTITVMRKIILIFGIIAGIIAGAMLMISMPLHAKGIINFENGMWVGYTTMVIALSMVFFGVKSYRDNKLQGVISFWKAFRVGMLIALTAAVIYALSWEVTYNTMSFDYMEKWTEYSINKMREAGASEAAMAAEKASLDTMSEYYKNPLIRFVLTLGEILPVGLVISLLSAALLRKKEFLPADRSVPTAS
jgi:hypothetical protein